MDTEAKKYFKKFEEFFDRESRTAGEWETAYLVEKVGQPLAQEGDFQVPGDIVGVAIGFYEGLTFGVLKELYLTERGIGEANNNPTQDLYKALIEEVNEAHVYKLLGCSLKNTKERKKLESLFHPHCIDLGGPGDEKRILAIFVEQ